MFFAKYPAKNTSMRMAIVRGRNMHEA